MPKMTKCAAPGCDNTFPMKKYKGGWKQYCSAKCADAGYNKTERSTATYQRDIENAFERAMNLAECYYGTAAEDRYQFMMTLVGAAQKDVVTRRALTNPALLKPNLNNPDLFHNGDRNHLTIAELADRFCRYNYGKTVMQVAKGNRLAAPAKPRDPATYDLRIPMHSKGYSILTKDEISERMEEIQFHETRRADWLIDYVAALHNQANDNPNILAEDLPEVPMLQDMKPVAKPSAPKGGNHRVGRIWHLVNIETGRVFKGTIAEFCARTNEPLFPVAESLDRYESYKEWEVYYADYQQELAA